VGLIVSHLILKKPTRRVQRTLGERPDEQGREKTTLVNVGARRVYIIMSTLDLKDEMHDAGERLCYRPEKPTSSICIYLRMEYTCSMPSSGYKNEFGLQTSQ
jgi:hypothetical protein